MHACMRACILSVDVPAVLPGEAIGAKQRACGHNFAGIQDHARWGDFEGGLLWRRLYRRAWRSPRPRVCSLHVDVSDCFMTHIMSWSHVTSVSMNRLAPPRLPLACCRRDDNDFHYPPPILRESSAHTRARVHCYGRRQSGVYPMSARVQQNRQDHPRRGWAHETQTPAFFAHLRLARVRVCKCVLISTERSVSCFFAFSAAPNRWPCVQHVIR